MVLGRQIVCTWVALVIACAVAQGQQIQVEEPRRWQPILESLSLEAVTGPAARTIIIGNDPRAELAGIRASGQKITVASLVDEQDPELEILWQEPIEVPIYELPAGAQAHLGETQWCTASRFGRRPAVASNRAGRAGLRALSLFGASHRRSGRERSNR